MKLSTYVREVDGGDYEVHTGRIVLLVMGVIALIVTIYFAIWGLGIITAPWAGRQNAHRIINNPLNQIAQYDHFFRLDADIHTEQTQVKNAVDALTAFNKENPSGTPDPVGAIAQQRAQLQNDVDGAANICTGNVNQYNNDAVAYTSSDFRSKALPAQESLSLCAIPSSSS